MRAVVLFAVIATSSLLLTGCQAADVAGKPASVASSSDSPTPTPVAVESVQPEPLTDLECADFARVASIGTIAGVTERDPRGVAAEMLDVVPLADVVRNAGGLACEFSDGGAWQVQDADAVSYNVAWRGAAIFVVPNVGAQAEELVSDSQCGDPIGNLFSVCQVDFAAGGSWVTVVSSTNDKGETFRAVRDEVKVIVGASSSNPGPIVRPEGTFEPPRDCDSLVPLSTASAILGGSQVAASRPFFLHIAAEATLLTENIGCEWLSSDSLAQAQVYPGGAWAAEDTLEAINGTSVSLDGLRDGEQALSHCVDESAYGYWICTVEVVVDGTWLRGIGNSPTEATSSAIAAAVAESMLAGREAEV
jgi:hypothetical protein